jgi:hypothetical protein
VSQFLLINKTNNSIFAPDKNPRNNPHLVRDDESPSQEDDLASGPGQDGFQEQSNSETEEETVT